jgi:trehalose 2-sulfotransferase
MHQLNFVVLTTSRTGSTWLINLLNQVGIQAHGELFLRQPRTVPPLVGRSDYKRFVDYYRGPQVLRVGHVVRYLNSLYDQAHIVGFKLMYGQIRSYPEIGLYLCARRIRIVHLIRENLLDAIVSEELARVTGTSHVRSTGGGPLPTVHLRTSDLIRRLNRRSRVCSTASKLARLSPCPLIEVKYENLLGDSRELRRVAEFLGTEVGDVAPNSELAKRGWREHKEAISNYSEVEDVLAETTYSAMLR